MNFYFSIKRILDVIGAIVLIIILSPLLLLTAVVIRMDSKGEILFKQERIGEKGNTFEIYKFRTMVQNAEKMGSGLDTFKGDTRVTRIGGLLRNSSLDELPQLLNILKGEMSFIGPRPPVTYSPYRYEDYPEYAKNRFNVKPGVTGYAQVNGRNNLSWNEKFKYDLEYVNNVSLIFDIKILFLTFIKVIKMEGSYDVKSERK